MSSMTPETTEDYAAMIGTCFEAKTVIDALDMSTKEFTDWVKDGELLTITTASKIILPAFQFYEDENGGYSVYEAASQTLKLFKQAGRTSEEAILWLSVVGDDGFALKELFEVEGGEELVIASAEEFTNQQLTY